MIGNLVRKVKYGDPYLKASDSKIIIIHIPKTGGNALANALWGRQDIGHWRAYDFYKTNPKKFYELKKYAVLRDPISRLLSAYNFLKNGGRSLKDKKYIDKVGFNNFSFDDLLEHLYSSRNINLEHIHFRTQSSFLYIDGSLAVDYLIDYEMFGSDVCRFFGVDVFNDLKVINKTESKEEILLSDLQLKKIKKIYKDDYELYETLKK
ncbi:sulfotransferase family 2 domain-containing protein [Marinomonas sp. NPDC078689]|uniref:sulfotransferase family 2 domain-containing protein n=1 Tax=Marinomonas sp. NPDC078689 TaxID=3364147 RepID=UPI0037C7EC04